MKIIHHTCRQALIATVIFILFVAGCRKAENSVSPIVDTSKIDVVATTGRTFTIVPDANGRLVIDNASGVYKAGDVLNLKGSFTGVFISNMSGSSSAPIIIQNLPGTVTYVGNPSWNGGSYAAAFSFTKCHYIRLGSGTAKANLVINGSTQAGSPAYFNIRLGEHTDNFEICRLTMNNGGTGIVAKTEPVKGDPTTAYPNSTMYNLLIHDITVNNTVNEGMYIGHTATYWDLTGGVPYYGPASGFASGHTYVQPIKWSNVKIYNNVVQNTGADGIQTAAIDKLEIYSNTVTNWAVRHGSADNGGILIGGRTTNTNTHDNVVRNAWGEPCQFYGSGENGATHIIKNNLFAESQGDGVSMRGSSNAIVQFVNNTVAYVKGNTFRVNGYSGQTGKQLLNANVFIAPLNGAGTIYAKNYIYTENGGQVTEGTGTLANLKYGTVAAAGVSASSYYQILNTASLVAGASPGYKR
jgi:hypothetical protein